MIVLGTAGHVDHGKTTFVKALTGIDTDRLKVEQERGITTELGFAHLDLGDGLRASVIDVPGHERFVRHMIAGAGGVDAALLVVAADEGVMPQTREHLDILGLVGVRTGLVVMTKCDLVDADGRELAGEDLASALAGTFLEGAPVLDFRAQDPGSHAAARTGVVRWLRERFPVAPPRPVDRPVRLPIDRVFVMKGFGAVVTGTLTAGRLSVGDEVEILPNGLCGRVRGLQRHGEPAERVEAGLRTAVNVQGVGYEEVRRGQVLSVPGALAIGTVVDATFTLLPRLGRGLKRRSAVVFHTGTLQTEATLVLLDRECLEPGESALAQVRLPGPIASLAGDPFVVRGFETLPGYGRTLGGGRILHPAGRPLRSGDPIAIPLLGRIRDGTGPERIAAAVEMAGVAGASGADLLAVTELGQRDLGRALGSLLASDGLAATRLAGLTRYFGPLTLRRIEDRLVATLSISHDRKPERDGFPIEDLAGALEEPVPIEVATLAAQRLVRDGRIEDGGGRLRIPGRVSVAARLGSEMLARVEAAFVEAGLATPTLAEVGARIGFPQGTVQEAATALVLSGRLVRAPENLIFAPGPLRDLKARVAAWLEQHGTMTTGQFKDLAGVSRKYAIPLMEWLDSERVTIRLGDGTRKLRYGGRMG